jgi:DNA-binding MarR family transcriptional regulator
MTLPSDWAEILRQAMVGLVRENSPDLTARQLAVLLTCTLESQPLSSGALAARIGLNPSAISHALRRLEELGLARRTNNPRDGRIVLAEVTDRGRTLVQHLGAVMQSAAAGGGAGVRSRRAAPDEAE